MVEHFGKSSFGKITVMKESIQGGILYSLVVFAVGFVMGPIRELFILPMVNGNASVAVLIEAPVLIFVMGLTAPNIINWCHVGDSSIARLAMGMTGLLVVLLADSSVGLFIRKWSFQQILQYYASEAGMINIGLFFVFASIPLLNSVLFG